MCKTEQTIRIVHWAGGYVVSGIGELRYNMLERQYGPIQEEE